MKTGKEPRKEPEANCSYPVELEQKLLEEDEMPELSKSVITYSHSHPIAGASPAKISSRLGPNEREILWLLGAQKHGSYGLRDYTGQSERDIERSIKRLKGKKLIEGEKEFQLTERGKGALLHLISKGKVWTKKKYPKVHTHFKVVAFDLDDTLIPGYVTKDVPVGTMKEFLEILRANHIKTAVLSVNTPSTVIERLKKYGLLQYIDYPVFTNKAEGVKVIEHTMNVKEDQILMVGHDWSLDWLGVKREHPEVPVAMLKDALSAGDSSTKKKPEGVIYIDRTVPEFLRVLRGEIKEAPDKKKLLAEVDHYKPVSQYYSAPYITLSDKSVNELLQRTRNGSETDSDLNKYSDDTLGKLRFQIEEIYRFEKDPLIIKNLDKALTTLKQWKIETVPFSLKNDQAQTTLPSTIQPVYQGKTSAPKFPTIDTEFSLIDFYTRFHNGDKVKYITQKGKHIVGKLDGLNGDQAIIEEDPEHRYSVPAKKLEHA